MTATAQTVLPTPLAEERSGWPYITVISHSGVDYTVKVENRLFADRSDEFRWGLSWGYSELAKFDDEGITWIPGWHEKDSPAVRALLTAFHLYKETT